MNRLEVSEGTGLQKQRSLSAAQAWKSRRQRRKFRCSLRNLKAMTNLLKTADSDLCHETIGTEQRYGTLPIGNGNRNLESS